MVTHSQTSKADWK